MTDASRQPGFGPLEGPTEHMPSPRQLWRALDSHSLTNGMTAFVMACTGPFAVLLGVGLTGGMSPEDISSWVLGGYGIGGLLSVFFSAYYRIPIGMGWTIPGVVLLGGALDHLRFSECVGAFYIVGALITVLGVSGWVQRISKFLPLNIVMAMVAGVFLPFVTKIVTGFADDWLIALVTLVVFLGLSLSPRVARFAPPILGAIGIGAIAIFVTGKFEIEELPALSMTVPVIYTPEFTWRATLELVLPLLITVVGIHNLQGFAITEANGYPPPRNTLTTACGLWSFVFAVIGTVPTCVTGPANGILNSSGEKERRYAGGVFFGVLMIGFGLFAPFTTALALAFPTAFIGLVGGLAMFDVLRNSFVAAFSGKLSIGALTTFIVTVADQPIANIGAPFWAVIFGLAASYLFERDALRTR